MIQVNELRIGNWVSIPECTLYAKIKSIGEKTFTIHTDGIDLDKDNDYFNYKSGEPIALSPELLEACGFEHSHHRFNAFESEERYSIYIAEDEEYAVCFVTETYGGEEHKYIRFRKLPDDILWLHEFKYFHQFQNAIYMYTGSELSVNLEKVKA